MKKIALILLAVLLSAAIFQKPLATHLKIILFITEEFPQIPIKPLGLLTGQPIHQKVELNSSSGKIVADLYPPQSPGLHSVVILAMGVKTSEKDKPLLFHFADTMARLGYVVFWPRLELLDRGESLPEEPDTFIQAFKYLKNLPQVDPKRISYVGFSVGSSTAFVAASDPEIADNVHGLVFFGGQFDIFEYLLALATKTIKMDGLTMPWDPDLDATNHAKSLLEVKGADQVLKIFDVKEATQAAQLLKQAPDDETLGLTRYSPKEKVNQFKAKIFILHDKSDTLVPYVESVKLYQALPKEQLGAYHISDLFEHVQPNRPINIFELVKLYGFLYKVLSSL
ncbi:hypothetical protein HYZ06_00495 [Candidatus Daviesbacteria bacterium]|nr:hypothetical protein [Candidatus Daviesbacteria bacterium]